MPFPESGPAGAAPAFAPQAPAAPPQAPAAPPAAPPPLIQQPALPNLWIPVNGKPELHQPAQYLTMAPTTQVHREDGIGGWQPLSKILPAAAAAPAQAPLNRTAFQPTPGPAQLPAQPASGGPDPALFAGMESAQINRRGSFITAGDYVLKLNSAELKTLRSSGTMSVICEWVVMVSSYKEANPATHACITEGSGVTTFIAKNDSFNSNMKELILALCGFMKDNKPRPETDVVTPQEVAYFLSPEQPFSGVSIYCEARDRLTKKNTNFTNLNYWPMPLKADGGYDFDRFMREVR